MAEILRSISGRSLGLDENGNLIVKGGVITGGQSPIVAAGSTLTLTRAEHAGKTIGLNTLTGSVVTLPAATGSGTTFRFIVTVLATSNSHIVKVANASDVMFGGGTIADTDTAGAAYSFMAAASSDTITLNRSTTGSVTIGEWIEVEDYATNLFHVRYLLSGTGTPLTPFSATV